MKKKKWEPKKSTNQNPYCGESSGTIFGNKSEERVLADMGAEQQIGSGSFDGLKSDGLLSVGDMDFRIECKATRKESIRLQYSWLRKIRDEAMETGKTPLLTISFTLGDGTKKTAGDWVMMPMRLFKEISGGIR